MTRILGHDELRKLAEAALEDDKAATPGPWHFDMPTPPAGATEIHGPEVDGDTMRADWVRIEDAALIAAARTREPELARAVLRLLEERNQPANPLRGKAKCPACGRMSRITTAGCDHCGLEDK